MRTILPCNARTQEFHFNRAICLGQNSDVLDKGDKHIAHAKINDKQMSHTQLPLSMAFNTAGVSAKSLATKSAYGSYGTFAAAISTHLQLRKKIG